MRGVGAGTRIFELIDRTPVINPDIGTALDPARRGRVRFENVGFEYPSRKGVEILSGFSLDLNVGESVAIVYVYFAWSLCPSDNVCTAEKAEVASPLWLPYYYVTMIPCEGRSLSTAKVGS